jgi:hypothetical protein
MLSSTLLAATAAAAEAQDAADLRSRRLVLDAGVTWAGEYPIGDSAADYRGNGVGSAPPPFTLFRLESSMGSVAGGLVRIGFPLSAAWVVEGGVEYATPDLRAFVTADVEAGSVTLDAAETLQQYLIHAGATWQLPRLRIARLRPFVTGGGGYVRQLYQESTMVETGSLLYAGGGARIWLRGGSPNQSSLGVRTDVRINWRQGGVEFAGVVRAYPTVSAAVFWQR